MLHNRHQILDLPLSCELSDFVLNPCLDMFSFGLIMSGTSLIVVNSQSRKTACRPASLVQSSMPNGKCAGRKTYANQEYRIQSQVESSVLRHAAGAKKGP